MVVAVMGPTLVLCVVGARLKTSRPAAAVLLGVVSARCGCFRRSDQGVWLTGSAMVCGRCWPPRALRVGRGRYRRHCLAAVGVPGRVVGRLAADDDRRRAGRGLDAGHSRPRGDGAAGRQRGAALIGAIVATVVATAALARSQVTRDLRAPLAERRRRGASVEPVLTAIALTPSAPVLVPELAGAAAGEVAGLRSAAVGPQRNFRPVDRRRCRAGGSGHRPSDPRYLRRVWRSRAGCAVSACPGCRRTAVTVRAVRRMASRPSERRGFGGGSHLRR